jgi:hypothetical protein
MRKAGRMVGAALGAALPICVAASAALADPDTSEIIQI